MNYSEKLRDPRWQKKRLEILQRDNWTCQQPSCMSVEKTLHVHHRYYIKNTEIWDQPNESLLTLCCDCHEEETNQLKASCEDLIQNLKIAGANSFHIGQIANVFSKFSNNSEFVFLLSECLWSCYFLEEICDIDIYNHLEDIKKTENDKPNYNPTITQL